MAPPDQSRREPSLRSPCWTQSEPRQTWGNVHQMDGQQIADNRESIQTANRAGSHFATHDLRATTQQIRQPYTPPLSGWVCWFIMFGGRQGRGSVCTSVLIRTGIARCGPPSSPSPRELALQTLAAYGSDAPMRQGAPPCPAVVQRGHRVPAPGHQAETPAPPPGVRPAQQRHHSHRRRRQQRSRARGQ
jgi:hypothetical protein